MPRTKKSPTLKPAKDTSAGPHKRTPKGPAAILPPTLLEAGLSERNAIFGRLADRLGAISREMTEPGRGHRHPENHSALCLTCGAAFDLAGGFCVEDRPEQVEIPYETCIELATFARDVDLPPAETAARLISAALFIMGRGNWRERDDLIRLWEVVDKDQTLWEAIDEKTRAVTA